MHRLEGSLIVLGDSLAAAMISLAVPSEQAGSWLREWVKLVRSVETNPSSLASNGYAILDHLNSAHEMVDAAKLVTHGS